MAVKMVTLVLFLFSAWSIAEEIPDKIDILVEQFPPYHYKVGEKIEGVNYDIINQLCEHAKIQCNFVIKPWNRAYRDVLNTANVGLLSTARTDEREGLFQWVGPLLSGENCVYASADNDALNAQEISELKDYTVVVTDDSPYMTLFLERGFKENENLIIHPQNNGQFVWFAAKRTPVFISSSTALPTALKSIGLELSAVKPLFIINQSLLALNYLAFNSESSPALIQRLQQALNDLREDKTFYRHIRERHLYSRNIPRPEGVESTLWETCMNWEAK